MSDLHITDAAIQDQAADLAYEFGERMPESRFEDVDGTPESALIKVTPAELRNLLVKAIDVGRRVAQNGPTPGGTTTPTPEV